MKMDGTSGPPAWKPPVNNGTELWEANLRNGGQPPPQPQQKTPWGHTPSTNIGGTWGEDDDADSSNVWTGVPSNQQQWGGASAGSNANNGAMWGGKYPFSFTFLLAYRKVNCCLATNVLILVSLTVRSPIFSYLWISLTLNIKLTETEVLFFSKHG